MGAYYRYHRNRACACPRCRISTSTGPAMMITIGVLFLLQTLHVAYFDHTWPVILIVLGVIKVMAYSASAEGHVPPFWQGPGMQPPGQGPVMTPPPSTTPPPSYSGGGNNPQSGGTTGGPSGGPSNV